MQNINSNSDILFLPEAVKLFRISKETLRQYAVTKKVRGRKFGVRWLFFKDELEQDIRNLAFIEREEKQWESTKEPIVRTGGFHSKRQMEKDYAEALNQLTKKKRKDS